MYKILITDGSELKVTETFESVEKLITENLSALGHEVVSKHYEPEELKSKIKDFDVIVVGEGTVIDKEIIDAATNLKYIVKAGTNLRNIDCDYAASKGVVVKNTPECGRNAAAELVIGHMLSISRWIFDATSTIRNMEWKRDSYTGVEIANRTLGLIGFDDTAKLVAQKAKALGMIVSYWDENGKAKGYDEFEYKSFDEIIKGNTYISLHVPYDPEKGCLIGKKEFMAMEHGCNFINISDGRLVDEAALLEALGTSFADMHIFGACLDVYGQEPMINKELAAHERVSLTPHVRHETYESYTARAREIVEVIRAL